VVGLKKKIGQTRQIQISGAQRTNKWGLLNTFRTSFYNLLINLCLLPSREIPFYVPQI